MTFSRSRYDTQIKLSPEELFEISQEISRKFAPNASTDPAFPPDAFPSRYAPRKFGEKPINSLLHAGHHSRIRLSPQEMFEISQEISRKYAPNMSTGTPELVLLPVDPSHLYAYWNLGDDKNITGLKEESANPLILRIYWRPDENAAISNTKIWFDVALDTFQSRQKIRLPIDGTAYSAVIGRLYPDNSLTVFADSNLIHVPFDKMRASPIQQRRAKLSAAEGIPGPALQNHTSPINAAETLYYEPVLPDAGAGDIYYKKDFDNELRAKKDRDNEILFFSKMKSLMSEQAISATDLGNCSTSPVLGVVAPASLSSNEHTIPKTNASEIFYCHNKNASGQEK
ncbi:MAG: DUF4912 domain-containing protein [Methylovulum sp.]|nr:MAG: DUF4912 domain-containing protein [Methylovulum sp.]